MSLDAIVSVIDYPMTIVTAATNGQTVGALGDLEPGQPK
jgi:hypothetical protein